MTMFVRPEHEIHWTRELRFRAYELLAEAIEDGRIRPITGCSVCVDCGEQATCYEHRNYFEPLNVEPVCKPCNLARGEGYPPVQGEPLYYKGGPKSKGWKWLEKTESKHESISGADSKDITDLCGYGRIRPMPDHRQVAFNEMWQTQHSRLTRGDLRCEYFKKHDPIYQEAMFI